MLLQQEEQMGPLSGGPGKPEWIKRHEAEASFLKAGHFLVGDGSLFL